MKRVLVYGYVAFSLVVATLIFVFQLVFGADNQGFLSAISFIILVPTGFILQSVVYYPYRYSLLGSYKRSPLPEDEQILLTGSSIIFFINGLPTFSVPIPYINRIQNRLLVFPSGLGIHILGYGKVFIRKEDFVSLESNMLTYSLHHNSNEIKSPISFINKKVFYKLIDISGLKS